MQLRVVEPRPQAAARTPYVKSWECRINDDDLDDKISSDDGGHGRVHQLDEFYSIWPVSQGQAFWPTPPSPHFFFSFFVWVCDN